MGCLALCPVAGGSTGGGDSAVDVMGSVRVGARGDAEFKGASMSTSTELEDLAQVARRRHVHFDVEPEIVFRGSARVKVGFQVRLWAVHQKGARALPGCPKCWDLVDELRQIAEQVVPAEERPTLAELAPYRPALYDSRVVPGADEVSVTIRLIHRDGYDRPVDPCEERCLREIRARLRALGITERG